MALLRSAATVGLLTLMSRVLGFVRDMLTAAFLGAGPVTDAFFVAQRLPNLFRSLFAEGAFNVAFVPLFAGAVATEGQAAARPRCSRPPSCACWRPASPTSPRSSRSPWRSRA
jgi:putative peptidoglycan lipid II flippase